jgi:hypothetical protein
MPAMTDCHDHVSLAEPASQKHAATILKPQSFSYQTGQLLPIDLLIFCAEAKNFQIFFQEKTLLTF